MKTFQSSGEDALYDAFLQEFQRGFDQSVNARPLFTTDAGPHDFPNILRSDLHSVRSTIEAYSNKGTITGENTESVGGLLLSKGQLWNFKCRVTHNGVTAVYHIDRWD